MVKEPFFVVIPIRGIRIKKDSFQNDPFERSWILIDRDDEAFFDKYGGESIVGNVNSIKKRLNPSSFLLVRYFDEQQRTVWDEEMAERKLSALNLALLLNNWKKEGSVDPWPRFVYRTRYHEYCDLPLTFFKGKCRSTGHTGKMGLLSTDVGHYFSNDLNLSLAEVDIIVDAAPKVIKNILCDEPEKFDGSLINGMASISSAFDTLTPGAFVAAMIRCVEVLLGSEEDKFKIIKRRTMLLVDFNSKEIVNEIFQWRNDYTHRLKQPPNDLSTFKAFALAVQVWGALEELYLKYNNCKNDVVRFLDACVLASNLKSDIAGLALLSKNIPDGPKKKVKWIDHYLSPH